MVSNHPIFISTHVFILFFLPHLVEKGKWESSWVGVWQLAKVNRQHTRKCQVWPGLFLNLCLVSQPNKYDWITEEWKMAGFQMNICQKKKTKQNIQLSFYFICTIFMCVFIFRQSRQDLSYGLAQKMIRVITWLLTHRLFKWVLVYSTDIAIVNYFLFFKPIILMINAMQSHLSFWKKSYAFFWNRITESKRLWKTPSFALVEANFFK